jgi:hypothetical protein
VQEQRPDRRHTEIIKAPEDLIYRSCYAPVDLRSMLERSETRSLIRRLPSAQIFFSLKELDDEEVGLLLPHLTEEQWTGILDLDIWNRDRADTAAFIGWERHILGAVEPVARKLIRATDPDLWELTLRKELKIHPRTEEDEFESEPSDGDSLVTPDSQFLVVLPREPEKARILRELLLRFYELDADAANLLIQESLYRTPLEIEEEAFQDRRRRIEDMGFPDYFDALSIYTPRPGDEPLTLKPEDSHRESTTLPAATGLFDDYGPLLLFRAMAVAVTTGSPPAEELIEELFQVCNKLLAADRVSPAKPARIRRGIRKAVSGINLGLAGWSNGEVQKAAQGLRRHYMVEFFQLGYGALLRLRRRARDLVGRHRVTEGTALEAGFEGLLRRYPILVLPDQKGVLRKRYLEEPADLQQAEEILQRVAAEPSPADAD